MADVLRQARRIVVKVGSSLVTNEGRGIDAEAIGNWCRQLAALAAQGRELVMVSSGAIAEGMLRLGWSTRPKELHEQQAAAAVGQMGLVQMYETQLRAQGMSSAQVLLTHADLADRERFHAWSTRMVSTSTPADMVRLLPALWQFLRYLRRLIALRRADPRDDLTSALIAAEEAGDTLSEDELLAMMVILLIAGHETTINLIGSGTLALLEHPGQLQRLRNEPALIKPAVEELARFTSPVELATERYARVDIPVHDVVIPRGEKVLVVLGSANRDERQFATPDVLDITREPNKHLAFGQGAHYCLGSPLARMEGQIAIGTLIERLPALRLVRQPAELRWNKGLFVRGLRQLPLAF